MLRIQRAQTDEALLIVDAEVRRRLASVLADWLAVYAGMQPARLSRESFDLVVELRRVLLSPDEARPPGTPAIIDRRARVDGHNSTAH